jgi:hypothetical protein
MEKQTVEQALFTYGNLMDLAGWMAAADPKRPIHELKEEAEVYIKEKLQPLSAPVEAGAGVLSKLLDYVKKSADYILDTDCKEDRYARQAYRDVLSHAAELITTPPTKEAEAGLSAEEVLDKYCSSIPAWTDNRKRAVLAAMEEYKRQPAGDGWVEITPETNEKFGESKYVLGLESDGGTPVVCWYNSKMGSWYVAHHLAPSIAINIIKWKPLTT